MTDVLVAGAGGAIGGHLVAHLVRTGLKVRAVDVKPPSEWWQQDWNAENRCLDLLDPGDASEAMRGVKVVYHLAADMGGMGYIANYRAKCMVSSLITLNLLQEAQRRHVERFFYASSACVYNVQLQEDPNVTALKESDAFPAMPEPGYGEEKLFSEQLCRYFRQDYGLQTRVARYHNVYGPFGTWMGGREKAPAAICRKIAQAKLTGNYEIDVWGDGEQTRSFMYVDDCVQGTTMIANGDNVEPVNLGSDELVSINALVDLVESIAGITVRRNYDLSQPQGVRGRNSDNTMMRAEYGWVPETTLASGLARTYHWIERQIQQSG